MRRGLFVIAFLPALAACGDPVSPPSPLEEKARAYIREMKAMDLEYERLHDDLAAKKPPEDAKRRLATILAGAERASRLSPRASEAENRDLAFEFGKFLDAARKLEAATWTGDEGVRAWRRLGTACAPCHELYRKDPDR